MKLSREIKTALLVIVAFVLLYIGINYLMSKSIFSSDRVFYAEYENVGGLIPSTSVMINGYIVGKVQDISLKPSGKSVVTFTLEHDFKFSKTSKIEMQEGLIGGKSLAIIPSFDNGPEAISGDTLQTLIKPGLTDLVSQKLTPLQEKIERAIVSADSLLTGMNQILDESSRAKIKHGISELDQTIANFKKASNSLNGILASNKDKLSNSLANVDQITSNLAKVSDSIAQLEFKAMVADLKNVIDSFDKITLSIEKGEGSVGKLLKDEKLYNNLEGASKQLEQLLEDMKLNPKRYVHFSLFGKKPKQYKPSEEENNKEKN